MSSPKPADVRSHPGMLGTADSAAGGAASGRRGKPHGENIPTCSSLLRRHPPLRLRACCASVNPTKRKNGILLKPSERRRVHWF